MTAYRMVLAAVLVFALLALGAPASLAQPATPQATTASTTSGSSMLIVENAGQWPSSTSPGLALPASRSGDRPSALGRPGWQTMRSGSWLQVARRRRQVQQRSQAAFLTCNLPPYNPDSQRRQRIANGRVETG